MEALDYLKPSKLKRQKRRDKRLDKELIECYRRGSRSNIAKGVTKERAKHNFDNLCSQEGIKSMHKGGTKSFNDNLEPLKRFLTSKVGKYWDKVYSELCEKMDKSTVSGLHVFNHLWGFVELHYWIEDGTLYHFRSGKRNKLYSTSSWPQFYIHAKTGVLMKAPVR